jgi:hypothetical protein
MARKIQEEKKKFRKKEVQERYSAISKHTAAVRFGRE